MIRINTFIFFLFLLTICFEMTLRASEDLSFLVLDEMASLVEKDLAQQKQPKALARFHGSDVSIRGFLFKSTNGRLVLAAEPNLKSCCVGSKDKIFRQIFIEGDVNEPLSFGFAVLLKGSFVIDPIKDASGSWQQIYMLKNARIVKQ